MRDGIIVAMIAIAGVAQLCSPWGASIIGVIGPLVQGPQQQSHKAVKAMIALTIGATLGALIVGIVLEGVSVALPRIPEHLSSVLLATGATLMLATDTLSRGRFSPWTWRRQTCAAWAQSRRHVLASLAWGLDLGLGFTTFRISSIYWIGISASVLFLSAASIPLVLVSYGLGLSCALALMLIALHAKSTYTTMSLMRWSRQLRYLLAVVTAVFVGLLIITWYIGGWWHPTISLIGWTRAPHFRPNRRPPSSPAA
jgi:hypothetical protein